MTDDQRRDLLKTEWQTLHGTIDGYDGRMLTIKAWSVTATTAGLAAGFATDRRLFLVVAAAAFLFWLTEGIWKTFQHAHYARIERIERYFRGKGGAPPPLQADESWHREWPSIWRSGLPRIMSYVHVAVPHVFVVVAALGLYFFGAG